MTEYSNDDLVVIENNLKPIFDSGLHEILVYVYQSGKLPLFMKLINMENTLPKGSTIKSFKKRKIAIVGASMISANAIYSITKAYGYCRDQIELCLDYDKAVNYDYGKLQYNDDYEAILFGPVPHSCNNKKGYESIISRLEKEKGFPSVYRLGGGKLRITKSTLKDWFEKKNECQLLVA